MSRKTQKHNEITNFTHSLLIQAVYLGDLLQETTTLLTEELQIQMERKRTIEKLYMVNLGARNK